MYYSKILTDLTRQEKNPVNKMYLSEISLKWKNFQQAAENPFSSTELLSETLSIFLSALHNRKFLHTKVRGNGFEEDSPVFWPNYFYDLASALVSRLDILKQPGISWDFQEFNYSPVLQAANALEAAKLPLFHSKKTPQILSLTLSIDFQYRITGKRNFIKENFKLPLLLFFVHKKLDTRKCFEMENYALNAKKVCSFAETFVICESLQECPADYWHSMPFKIFAMGKADLYNQEVISSTVIENLQSAIERVITQTQENNLVSLQGRKPEGKPKKKPGGKRRRNYRKPGPKSKK